MKQLLSFLIALSTSGAVAQNPYVVEPKRNDAHKIDKTVTAEEQFVADNFEFIHMADWKEGMRFMVQQRHSTDPDNPAIASKLNLKPYKKKSGSPILQKDFEFKIFTVSGLEERQVSCPRGKCIRTYVILECGGEKYEYEYLGSINEMRKSDVFTSIDKLIYLDEIDKAKELLIGKRLYILDNVHYKTFSNHPRFIPVTISNVGIGTTSLLGGPIKIVYSIDSGKEHSTEIKLSGTNSSSQKGSRFSEMFSFEDPRTKYPDISNEIWELIQDRKVRVGMTELECELSWGRPEKINSTISDSGKQQQWVYSTSSYLYFEGGRLTTIQN